MTPELFVIAVGFFDQIQTGLGLDPYMGFLVFL